MLNARQQAEQYAKALPASEGWPPFLIVCDVGHCFEIYADFTGQGKNYAQFPDRQGFRIYLEELRDEKIRERFASYGSIHISSIRRRSPRRPRARSRERLAKVSKHLEEAAGADGKKLYDPEQVALFLMRCLFTMFAEDVELLPKDSFRELLKRCVEKPALFTRLVGQLWEAMDKGGFAYAIERDVKKFNGYLFKNRTVLRSAARGNRRALRGGAGRLEAGRTRHFRHAVRTGPEPGRAPQARRPLYAARLCRAARPRDRDGASASRMGECSGGGGGEARRRRRQGRAALVQAFHEKLCDIRILDPACGTGNFLYVSLELMKRLEGEVLEALVLPARTGALRRLRTQNHRPASVSRASKSIPARRPSPNWCLWIGFLQWHFRTRGGMPPEPILLRFQDDRGAGRGARVGRKGVGPRRTCAAQ